MKNQESEKIRLLMVDDEEEFLASTAQALNRRGIDVKTAFDGAMALKLIKEYQFDVIVLDVKMPGIDGDEVFRRVKEIQPQLPVILLTGHGSVPHAFESSKGGVYDYLTKPCDMDTLLKVVQEAASQVRNQTDTADSIDDSIKSGAIIQVLIVDDEVELLESLKNVLQRRRMKVITAQNGEEALELMKESSFEVVVLDVKMPGMDGIEALQRMKKDFPNMEVVLLTGHPTVDTALAGVKQGAFDYVTKPPDVDELAEIIRKAYLRREDNIIKQQQKIIEGVRERFPD
ncbi:MAG: response regulator [Candidatus Electryonea clarkiae]|nr:response regulator [Candidatus Electryonea clarkiae]MDP8287048.1 response regulator [Candidatus Electryonea clarkiae]